MTSGQSSNANGTPAPDPTIRSASRLADVPGDLTLGLLYGRGASAPPTSLQLWFEEKAFPGMFTVALSIGQAQDLATALRARSGRVEVTLEASAPPGLPIEMRAIEIRPAPSTLVGGRTDVLGLYFPRAFPGALYILIAHDAADRLAFQCDTMPHEFERCQPGYTGPDAEPPSA